MTMIAVASFSARYDGTIVEVIAGVTRCDDDHDLVAEFPDAFERERNPQHNGRRVRTTDGRGQRRPQPAMSLEQELAVRARRLAQLDQRARDRPAPPDAEAVFWAGVERLLADPRQEAEDRAGMKVIDDIEAGRKRSMRDEIEDLSSWLDDA